MSILTSLSSALSFFSTCEGLRGWIYRGCPSGPESPRMALVLCRARG